jgi:hypothetical protein
LAMLTKTFTTTGLVSSMPRADNNSLSQSTLLSSLLSTSRPKQPASHLANVSGSELPTTRPANKAEKKAAARAAAAAATALGAAAAAERARQAAAAAAAAVVAAVADAATSSARPWVASCFEATCSHPWRDSQGHPFKKRIKEYA